MVQTNAGTILAFAEARKNSSKDTGDIDLVLRRSSDGGRTWGEIITVWDDAENVCGNPTPVVDRTTGRILLFSIDVSPLFSKYGRRQKGAKTHLATIVHTP